MVDCQNPELRKVLLELKERHDLSTQEKEAIDILLASHTSNMSNEKYFSYIKLIVDLLKAYYLSG